MKREALDRAAWLIQDLWRRHAAWRRLVRAEEARARAEAERLKQAYLFAGKSAEELRAMRRGAQREFEDRTSELGRHRARDALDEQLGRGPRRESQAMGVWMETLKLLMQREAAEGVAGGADGGGGGRAGSPAAVAGVSAVMAYTAVRNPAEVDNAISEQRQAHGPLGARTLVLCRMGLIRWPFGVSDRTGGRAPWVELQTVHLSHNKLKGLPLDFYGLTGLTELRLDDNRVGSLSSDLGRLSRLRVLWLHQNRLADLPREVGRLAELEMLTLNANQLRGLPYEMGALSRLHDLPLLDNPLVSPPPELAQGGAGRAAVARILSYLNRFAASLAPPHRLNLAGLRLRVVPSDVRTLTATADLELADNRLEAMPEEVFWDARFGLPRHLGLTRLSLARNALARLPPVVARLARLRELDVSGNPLSDLPLSLTALTSLTSLSAAEAPLQLPPIETVAHGVDSVRLAGCKHHPDANALYRITSERRSGRPVFAAGGGGESAPRLYCGGRNGATYWCVGPPGADENSSWLRVLDSAARPADVNAVWDEVGADGLVRANPSVEVKGLGVMPFLRRVAALGREQGELAALRAKFEKNEGILQAARKVQLYLDLRAENQAELARRAASLSLNLSGLLLRSVPSTEWSGHVRTLLLDGNRLGSVPECMFRMGHLEVASLRYNALRDANGPWRRLKRLRELRLDRNCLAGLPAAMGRLPVLETLGLGYNSLNDVPDCVLGLVTLRDLDLQYNAVRGLPDGMSTLQGLTSLDLSFNDVADLGPAEQRPDMPGALAGLRQLRMLRLVGNRVSALPAALAGLTALTLLAVGRNQLGGGRLLRSALLGAGDGAVLLTSLDLSQNKVVSMDFSLRAFKLLADVNLAGNELDHIPLAVHSLPALRTLNISGNFLDTISPHVGRLTGLKALRAARNQIATLAPDLRRCGSLTLLDLSHNVLRHLPPAPGMNHEVFGSLKALVHLDVSNNRLVDLPADLARAVALRSLSADGNAFKEPVLRDALRSSLGALRVEVVAADGLDKLHSDAINTFCTVALSPDPDCRSAGPPQRTAMRYGTDQPEWGETFTLFCGAVDAHAAAVVTLFNSSIIDPSNPSAPGEGDGPVMVGAAKLPVAACVMRALPLLGFFPFASLAAAAGQCTMMTLEAGQALARRGDEAGPLHVLLTGSLRETNGVESRDLAAGGVCGAMSALTGEPRDWEAHAAEASAVLVVPEPVLAQMMRSNPDAVAALLLWAFPQSDAAARVRAARPAGLVWGSEGWSRRRREEDAVFASAVRRSTDHHGLPADLARHILAIVEAACARCAGEGHFALDPSAGAGAAPSDSACWLPLAIEEGTLQPHRARQSEPRVLVRASFSECTNRDRIANALDGLARSGGGAAEVARQRAAVAAARRRTTAVITKRETPNGLVFESEQDEVRQDEDVGRARTTFWQLSEERRRMRRPEVWEAMPILLGVDGPGERPWATAGSREEDFAAGTYYGMAPLLVSLVDGDPAIENLRPRAPEFNRHMVLEVATRSDNSDAIAMKQSHSAAAVPPTTSPLALEQDFIGVVPKHGATQAAGDSTLAGLRRTVLGRWQWLSGLLLLLPFYLKARRAEVAGRPAQDRVLAGISAVQRHSTHVDGVCALRTQLDGAAVLEAQMREELAMSKARLAVGWDAEAFAQHRRATATMVKIGRDVIRWQKEKARAKTANALLTARADEMRWLQPAWREGLYRLFAEQAPPGATVGVAASDVRGGTMEADMLRDVAACDTDDENGPSSMDPEEVVAWAAGHESFCKCPGRRVKILAFLKRHRLGGRVLIRLRRGDMMDMGLDSPSSSLLIEAVRILCTTATSKESHSVAMSAKAVLGATRLEWLSARFAEAETEEAETLLLENEVCCLAFVRICHCLLI